MKLFIAISLLFGVCLNTNPKKTSPVIPKIFRPNAIFNATLPCTKDITAHQADKYRVDLSSHDIPVKRTDQYKRLKTMSSAVERSYCNEQYVNIQTYSVQEINNDNDNDTDSDGINNESDNCPDKCNRNQFDADNDGIGDVCDDTPGCGGCGQPACEQECDDDNDFVPNSEDNCPYTCNINQLDADNDSIGDVCDDLPGCGGCGLPACEKDCGLSYSSKTENLVPYSEAFDQNTWELTNVTITEMEECQKLEQNPSDHPFLQAKRIPSTSDKFISVIVQCKPTAIDAQFTELLIWDTGINRGKAFRLPLDRFSNIKLKTSVQTTSDILLKIQNPSTLTNFGLYIERVHVYESIAPALYNNGDSIAVSPVENYNVFYCNSYADLYADKYNIDFKQKAAGGERLDQIRLRVQEDLAGAIYPIIFLEGGTNDILQATTDPVIQMLAELELMISAAKAASDNIVLFTAPSCPAYNSLKLSWVSAYNAELKSRYQNDSSISIIDMDTVLSAEDYDVNDKVHPTIDAHVKIFNAVDAAIDFPSEAARCSYVKTESAGISPEP